MPRLNLPSPENMNMEQLRVYNKIVSGKRSTVIGPLRAAILNPELAEHWSGFGEFLRFSTTLSARLRELAIIVTSRRWSSHLEWLVHAKEALNAGLSEDVVEAIRCAEPPVFDQNDEKLVYEFTRQLQQYGNLSDDIYQSAVVNWGEAAVVELTALIGYYTMVAMTLNAHEITPPDENQHQPLPPLSSGNRLIDLPPAK